MMTTHINNTAADRRRCPSQNAISSSPLSGDVLLPLVTGAAKVGGLTVSFILYRIIEQRREYCGRVACSVVRYPKLE